MKILKFIPLLLICISLQAEDVVKPPVDLKPTGEEIQRLAKLKEKVFRNRSQLETLQAQAYAVNKDIILKKQDINKAVNDLNLASINIKDVHKKDWGEPDTIEYNPDVQGVSENDSTFEGGIFKYINKVEDKVKKEDIKDGSKESKKENEGSKKEINKKILINKDKKNKK